MSNVLKREKQDEIRALGRLGRSLRRIEEATGVRRETASRYLRDAGIVVREPRGRRLASSKPASQVTTDLECCSEASPTRAVSSCEPYREMITEAMDRGRNAKAIWQDLVDDHGFDASYESVKRSCRKLRGGVVREAHPTIVTEPGEEGQVDYGTGPLVRDAKTGKHRRTRLFVLTLGYCRKAVLDAPLRVELPGLERVARRGLPPRLAGPRWEGPPRRV